MTNTSVPTTSRCAMGLSVSRPRSLAVGSPSRVATYAWLNSWKVRANRSGGIIRRMPVTSPTDPPPSPSASARRGSLELGLVLGRSDGRLGRMSEPAPRGSPYALGIQLEQRLLELARIVVSGARDFELRHGSRPHQGIVLVGEGPVLDPLQLLRPLPRVEGLRPEPPQDRRYRVARGREPGRRRREIDRHA